MSDSPALRNRRALNKQRSPLPPHRPLPSRQHRPTRTRPNPPNPPPPETSQTGVDPIFQGAADFDLGYSSTERSTATPRSSFTGQPSTSEMCLLGSDDVRVPGVKREHSVVVVPSVFSANDFGYPNLSHRNSLEGQAWRRGVGGVLKTPGPPARWGSATTAGTTPRCWARVCRPLPGDSRAVVRRRPAERPLSTSS